MSIVVLLGQHVDMVLDEVLSHKNSHVQTAGTQAGELVVDQLDEIYRNNKTNYNIYCWLSDSNLSR